MRDECRSTKIFWTDEERAQIVRRAVELLAAAPDCSGVPLLREAIEALPPSRRREIRSLSQVHWFMRAVSDEIRLGRLDSTETLQSQLREHEARAAERFAGYSLVFPILERLETLSGSRNEDHAEVVTLLGRIAHDLARLSREFRGLMSRVGA